MKYIGVDIGGTEVKLGIIDERGKVLSSGSCSVSFDQYETPILDTVIKSLDIFLADHLKTSGEFDGIGVSATGQIDIHNGIVAGTAGHIKNWQGSCIKETMESKYGLPVTVMNDANCAALAEKWIGAAKDASEAIVVTFGTGVGGGIIVNSEILVGHNGLAGELGHFTICNEGKKCSCQNTGCYEQYASTAALIHMVEEAVENGLIDRNIFEVKGINGKTIFEQLEQFNSGLSQIVEEWLDYVADGLVSLVHIFNPQLILLGGGVSVQEKHFIKPVRRKVLERVMPAFCNNLDIQSAKLGNDAGMVGAVYYFIKCRKKWDTL